MAARLRFEPAESVMNISKLSKSYGVIVPIVALFAFIPYEVVSHQATQPGRGTGRGQPPQQNPGPPPRPPAPGQPRGGYRGAPQQPSDVPRGGGRGTWQGPRGN